MKFCINPKCGKKLIKRILETKMAFTKRMTCNHDCLKEHFILTDPRAERYCQTCAKKLVFKLKETISNFKVRLTCNEICAKGLRYGHPKIQPVDSFLNRKPNTIEGNEYEL